MCEILLFKCLHVYVCVCVWLQRLANSDEELCRLSHRNTPQWVYPCFCFCLYFNELGLSLQYCTLQRLFTQDKCDNNPPPPHPADYPPLTHRHILTFSPKHHTLAQAHIKSTRPRRERWDCCQIQLVSTDDCKRQNYHACRWCALCWKCALSLQALHDS